MRQLLSAKAEIIDAQRRFPPWVKAGKAQREQMFSALPSEAAIAGERHHPSERGPFLHRCATPS
jgi:hypothetical protein